MATILKFPSRPQEHRRAASPDRSKVSGPKVSGQVIIYPGVRYEKQAPERSPSSRPSGSLSHAPKRQTEA